jgi:hypothetical protein
MYRNVFDSEAGQGSGAASKRSENEVKLQQNAVLYVETVGCLCYSRIGLSSASQRRKFVTNNSRIGLVRSPGILTSAKESKLPTK